MHSHEAIDIEHQRTTMDRADVVGMWVTGDGHIRQELRADGRYDEARGSRRSAYTGRYTVTGNHQARHITGQTIHLNGGAYTTR